MKDLIKELIRDPFVPPRLALLGFCFPVAGGSGLSLITGDLLYLILGLILGILAAGGFVYFGEAWEWTCPSCQEYPFSRTSDYCPNCGQRMRFMRKRERRRPCPNGHRLAERWDRFCPKCGAPL